MSHYDTLRVSPVATSDEIRDAYRRLARQHHPDRGGRDVAPMAAINEAYRVLRDPARRAVYDAGRRPGSAVGPTARPTSWPDAGSTHHTRPVSTTPARYPWKLVAGMAVVGAAVVLVGAALYEPADEPAPDNLLGPGSCVVIETNGDAREVSCERSPESRVVVALVAFDERCPAETEGYRDRQGRGTACVEATMSAPVGS